MTALSAALSRQRDIIAAARAAQREKDKDNGR